MGDRGQTAARRQLPSWPELRAHGHATVCDSRERETTRRPATSAAPPSRRRPGSAPVYPLDRDTAVYRVYAHSYYVRHRHSPHGMNLLIVLSSCFVSGARRRPGAECGSNTRDGERSIRDTDRTIVPRRAGRCEGKPPTRSRGAPAQSKPLSKQLRADGRQPASRFRE